MFCEKCGNKINDGESRCLKCGKMVNPVNNNRDAMVANINKTNKKNLILSICLLVSVFVLIGVICIAIFSKGDVSDDLKFDATFYVKNDFDLDFYGDDCDLDVWQIEGENFASNKDKILKFDLTSETQPTFSLEKGVYVFKFILKDGSSHLYKVSADEEFTNNYVIVNETYAVESSIKQQLDADRKLIKINAEAFKNSGKSLTGENDDTSTKTATYKKPENALGPAKTAEIFANNRDKWIGKESGHYTYYFIDLDFDGNAELLVNRYAGTGGFSYNNFYKINTSNNLIEEIEVKTDGVTPAFDLTSGGDLKPKLLMNKKDGSMKYFCGDQIRLEFQHTGTTHGWLMLKNGVVTSEPLFTTEHNESPMKTVNTPVDQYAYYENKVRVSTTKEEYEKKMKEFLDSHVDLNVTWGSISGKDLNGASSEQEILEMLTRSCEAYSFDGYK